ncbi:MAG: gluconate 2-dehydrogenase subunit 3 family protein, partial [Rhodothermales bacterium]
MQNITRREALKLAALAPLAAGFTWSAGDAQKARDRVAKASAFPPQFFTEHEYETVKVLVDIILPADERSGSATEAGVPEFMDFMMIDRPDMQVPMRGGLGWLDYETYERHAATFLDSTDEQRRSLLDL